MSNIEQVTEEKIKKLANIIKNSREKKHLSIRALADKSDLLTISEISFLENAKRKKPDPIILKALAQALGDCYLMYFEILGYIEKNELISSNANLINSQLQEIPVYGSISTGHGEPIYGELIQTIVLPYTSKNCIATLINGDSMEPKFPDKSIVIIDKDDIDISNNDVMAFIVNDESLVKRVILKGDNLILTSDNPAYSPIYISKYDEINVIGKIIGVYMTNRNFWYKKLKRNDWICLSWF